MTPWYLLLRDKTIQQPYFEEGERVEEKNMNFKKMKKKWSRSENYLHDWR